MRIIYKQTDDHGGLGSFGVKDCCFKRLSLERDKKRITKKTHHHTSFEMHFVTQGFQEYEVCGEKYRLESGSFLLIYPSVPHTVISCKPDTQKYSITFNKPIESTSSCLFGKCNGRVSDSLRFISEEALRKKEISSTLIENCILEILVWAFRISGLKEDETEQKQDENLVLSMAKQYIEDNVELNPSVSDVADHLRNKCAVVLTLEYTDKDTARRLVDFLTGCAYALDGNIQRVATSTYIITPFNVDVVGNLKEELKNSGIY